MQIPDYITDVHTHTPGRPDAILSLPPRLALAGCTTPYSLQLHPWYLSDGQSSAPLSSLVPDAPVTIAEFVSAADRLQSDPLFLAIGECGLDNRCSTPVALQLEALRVALSVAHRLHLPVIIHCVGLWSQMQQCCRQAGVLLDPSTPVIIHGFRKGPQLARQLLSAGFHISLGEKFNPEVAKIVPSDRLWFETDESALDILEIRQTILEKRKG